MTDFCEDCLFVHDDHRCRECVLRPLDDEATCCVCGKWLGPSDGAITFRFRRNGKEAVRHVCPPTVAQVNLQEGSPCCNTLRAKAEAYGATLIPIQPGEAP